MNEYVIIGDTEKYEDCLVFLCGTSYKHAENMLERLTNNPTEDDKKLIAEFTNLRIKEVEETNCWWNYGCD